MVTVLDALCTPSEAVSCKTYVPEVEKLAVVDSALTLPNLTVPGPLNADQVVVTVPEKPLTVPFKLAYDDKVMV